MAYCSEFHPLDLAGCLEASAEPSAGSWHPVRSNLPGRLPRTGASEGSRNSSKRGHQVQQDACGAFGRFPRGMAPNACVIVDSLGYAIAFRGHGWSKEAGPAIRPKAPRLQSTIRIGAAIIVMLSSAFGAGSTSGGLLELATSRPPHSSWRYSVSPLPPPRA